jgi:ATP-binding cassette subfamily F protein uup
MVGVDFDPSLFYFPTNKLFQTKPCVYLSLRMYFCKIMNYLSADNISKSYDEKWLFRNLSFGIGQGERVALVGKNGCGKTTLMSVLSGLIEPDGGSVSTHKGISVGFLGQNPVFEEDKTVYDNIFSLDNPMMATVKAYEDCLEHPEDNDAYHTRLQDLMERMEDMKAWDYEVKIKQIIGKLGIGSMQDRLVSNLSGGQRKRVAMARVLISEPDLLIMDEPTNHLDLETIEWLEGIIHERFQTVLIVTHDRYFLDNVANEVVELDGGQIYRYKGNYAYFLEKKAEREHAKDQEIDKAKNLLRKELEWMRRQPKARGTKAKYRIDAFYETQEKASQTRSTDKLELNLTTSRQGGKVLEVNKISKSYADLKIIDNFEYVFRRGDRIGIVGKNGVGKSTFLNMLLGKTEPDTGEIYAGQTTIFGHYSQEEIRLEEDKRVIEVVKEIAEHVVTGDGETISASKLLEHFMFPPAMQYNYVSKLSGGEKRRLQLLKVLIKNPNFLVLDEPTNDFDIESLNILEEFLLNFKGCLLLVSHDRYFMDRLVEHVFVFEGDGKIKDFPGNYTEYREWLKELEEEKSKAPKIQTKKEIVEPAPNTQSPTPNTSKKKLSFKEKHEFESIEKELPLLEVKKKDITEKMNAGGSHKELSDWANEVERISNEIDEKTLRWLELSE